ncbi:rhomboid family intramembrane serine protease [Miltoncostaea marina]|uniref:rhomboid family intramembrane serine protease n=1 Tax=Miltoncostaea marina TaxID=2843215 RepID=UPI001C3D1024|nr:rhomboid family intramembrane serine protease [Miltoncostaea marina]
MATTHETSAPDTMRCYRHPDRETLLSCSNCERPICTQCMTQAPVGVRCPECAGGGRGPAAAARRHMPRAATGAAVATGVLVALNVIVYLGEMAQGVGVSGVGGSQLVQDGAVYGPAVADGEWWRMITGGFLHASVIHVAFNMYLLWMLGGALERYAGAGRMLAVYGSAVLWGSAGALLFTPDSLTVGASGGVFGLMAALYLLERQRGVQLLGSTVGMLLLLNLVITFVLPGISIGGHLGGIAGGAAAGFALSGFGRGHMAYGRLGVAEWATVGALIVGAVVVGVAVAA